MDFPPHRPWSAPIALCLCSATFGTAFNLWHWQLTPPLDFRWRGAWVGVSLVCVVLSPLLAWAAEFALAPKHRPARAALGLAWGLALLPWGLGATLRHAAPAEPLPALASFTAAGRLTLQAQQKASWQVELACRPDSARRPEQISTRQTHWFALRLHDRGRQQRCGSSYTTTPTQTSSENTSSPKFC